MSEDATQQLLIARVDQLISLVALMNENLETQQGEMSASLHNLETQQGEMSASLHNLETQQAEMSARLHNLETQQGEMSGSLHNLETQQGEMSARLERIENIVDQRLYDTRPLWESVLSQIAELDKKIDTRVEELRAETSSGFRAVDRKIGALSKNLVDMTAEIQDLREIVEKLEAQPA
jgi:chromosome segregation ATPase